MKTYTFTDAGYWSSSGCSCCEDVYMEAYSCEDIDYTLGADYSVFDCYVHSIITSLGGLNGTRSLPDGLLEQIWGMSLIQLESLCNDLCINVVIEGDNYVS